MTWFSLPPQRKDNPPAFVDLDGCNAWLATQPQANAPQMQEVLAAQLESLNGWAIAPRERYKLLSTLRKQIFAIETESAKRYESRPIPLSAIEQKVFDNTCRLWRQLAVGYLHCLRACLDQDTALAEHRAKIAHRALTSLRLEQLARYRTGFAIPGVWWRTLHATLAAADQLGVTGTMIGDPLFAETRESTPGGQYAMALLLHLARPQELSRNQLTSVVRWLARWRELARLYPSAEAAGDSRTVVIELTGDQPIHVGRGAPGNGRWLAIDSVLGKLKSRLKDLRDGKTPEELHLGSALPAEACVGLLQYLHGALQAPAAPPPSPADALADVGLATTVDNIYQLFGGRPLSVRSEPTAQSNRAVHEQIAIFGHVRGESETPAEAGLEPWQLLVEQDGGLILRRAADAGGERLGNRCLVAVRTPDGNTRLAIFRSLAAQEDGSLLAWAKVLPGSAEAMTANGRERVTNRHIPLPAIFLPAPGLTGGTASLFVPAGVTAKLIRLDVADLPTTLKVGAALDRGSNYERLGCE